MTIEFDFLGMREEEICFSGPRKPPTENPKPGNPPTENPNPRNPVVYHIIRHTPCGKPGTQDGKGKPK